MSDELDFPKLIEGMTREQAVKYVTSHLNQQTREKFLEGEKAQTVTKAKTDYDVEVSKVMKMDLTQQARIRKISALQRQYGIGVTARQPDEEVF